MTETEKGSGDTADIAMTVTGITEGTDGNRDLCRERGNIGDGGRARAQGAGTGEETMIATDDIGTRTAAIVHIHVKEIQTIIAVELTSEMANPIPYMELGVYGSCTKALVSRFSKTCCVLYNVLACSTAHHGWSSGQQEGQA